MEVLGIGTEITECLRIARMIERHGELFVNRVFTPEEIRFCQNRKQSTQHFTGRWVAKEAVLKAIGTGWRPGISWLDIEIHNDTLGRSLVVIRGLLRDLAEQAGIRRIHLSIAYCRSHATAYAIALGEKRANVDE
jgi:holo-[acyl-carrier protein] synthase